MYTAQTITRTNSDIDIGLTHGNRINLNSLNIVRDELAVTIEQAATQLEGFVSDRENARLLQECIDSLQQIRGSLELIELHGATELASALLDAARSIVNHQINPEDEKLSILTRGFFVLSCYFEYALKQEQGMPALLVSHINDILLINRQPVIWESHFADAITSFRLPLEEQTKPASTGAPSGESGESIEATIRRVRQMYQLGLLGLIRELRVPASLQLMQRAAEKIHGHATGSGSETLWWLLCHTLSAFAKARLSVTPERKRLFSRLDREFKRLEKEGWQAFDHPIDESFLKELAYYVALSGLDEDPWAAIVTGFGYSRLGYNESDRLGEVEAMTGPSASAVSSVVETLKAELRTVKNVMESVSEEDDSIIDGLDDLPGSMMKIHDILGVIGLETASKTIEQQIEKLKQWRQSGDRPGATALAEIASALVYVESVLDRVEKLDFSHNKLAKINELSQEQIVLGTQLDSGRLLVLEEAESALGMVKRSLDSFVESSCDSTHIKNVPKVLNDIRGAMVVLELPRAAEVVAKCIRFIDGSLLATEQSATPEHLKHMLETFADALICLEYYLDCIKVDSHTSNDALAVAEESLAALGYGA